MSPFRKLIEWLSRQGLAAFRSGIESAVVDGCGGTVMLGDSITHIGRWDLLFPDARLRNLGIAGERSAHLLDRLEPLIRIRAEKLFLLIGTNDVGAGITVEEIAVNVATLLDTLAARLPGCRLHLQSVMPRQRKFAPTIRQLNARYAEIAAQRGIVFIDLYPLFDDGRGEIRAELSHDRLHLTGAGYAIWRSALSPYILGEPA